MSGGIDSSAAAYILKRNGFNVTGVTFTALNKEGLKKCCSIEEIAAAKDVCRFLGIKHKIIDIRDIFEAKIIKYFIDSYRSGLTPNPCVYCNRFVKFGAMLEYALSEGADYFATGHYAGIEEINGNSFIKKGTDKEKDQSYFLSYIEKEKLPYIKLPLGAYKKQDVREIIKESGLPVNPHKPESQDVCFINGDYRDFLIKRGVEENPGDFIYLNKTAGFHKGIPFYSLGQRRGLNISVGNRAFIREFDLENNRIMLGDKPLSREFTVRGLNIFTGDFTNGRFSVQIRYRSNIIEGSVKIEGDGAEVFLIEPQEIISPGQFAVFYRDDLVYASGVIRDVRLIS